MTKFIIKSTPAEIGARRVINPLQKKYRFNSEDMHGLSFEKARADNLLDILNASLVSAKIASDDTKTPGKNIKECKHNPFKLYAEYKYASDIPIQTPRKNGRIGVNTKPYIDKPIKKAITKKKNVKESDVIKKFKHGFVIRS